MGECSSGKICRERRLGLGEIISPYIKRWNMRVYQDAINQVQEQWKDSADMVESIQKIVGDEGLVNSTMNIVEQYPLFSILITTPEYCATIQSLLAFYFEVGRYAGRQEIVDETMKGVE